MMTHPARRHTPDPAALAGSVLRAIVALDQHRPSHGASAEQVATWYTCKADLLDQIARTAGPDTGEAGRDAATARRRARGLAAASSPSTFPSIADVPVEGSAA